MRIAILLSIVLPAQIAAADSFAVRVDGGIGAMKELTWTAPGVDLIASHVVRRAFVELALGYSPIDNHTFLADGRMIRLALAAGGRLAPRVRAAGVIDIESIAFHADPDVLVDHPDVDVAPRRGGFVPTLGGELGFELTPATVVGVFGRVAVRRLELFDSPSGDRADARLVLGGAFLELRLH